jgi:hypothetical protein
MGAARPGDDVLFGTGRDPSDTFIGRAWDEFDAGRAERGAK